MRRSALNRLAFAGIIYALLISVFSSLHDYPQFRAQLQKLRDRDSISEERLWLNTFYFINEAGSGLKFFLTADEKHMRYYPSPSHILAARRGRAKNGNWEAQILVSRMYYFGDNAPRDIKESLFWLRAAHETAPPERKDYIQHLINALSEELNLSAQ